MFIKITKEQIDEIFKNRNCKRWEKNIKTYIFLLDNIKNAHKKYILAEYQRNFNYFYQVRRNIKWRSEFYKLFFKYVKSNKSDFSDVLMALYKRTGNVEASFSSKFIATINPKLPIIDRHVLSFLGEKLPSYKNDKDRIAQIVKLYEKMNVEFADFLENTEEGKYLVKKFVSEYPDIKISKMKMLDFVLWQSGGKHKLKNN
jgi:hypothetical protein